MHIIKRKNFKQTAIASAMVMVCLLSACGKDEKQQQAGGNFAIPVEYSSVKIADIPVYSNLIGRATAVRTAEVRPQVSGVILKRYFQEGSVVKQGEQLYQIDPATLQIRQVQKLKFEDIERFYEENVQGKPVKILVIGDPKQIDLKALKAKFGKVNKLNADKLFGE